VTLIDHKSELKALAEKEAHDLQVARRIIQRDYQESMESRRRELWRKQEKEARE